VIFGVLNSWNSFPWDFWWSLSMLGFSAWLFCYSLSLSIFRFLSTFSYTAWRVICSGFFLL
jgi:hypothetical protein